jgi:hypothetical protein
MKAYCYRCTSCGERFEQKYKFGAAPATVPCGWCSDGEDNAVRDYRAENPQTIIPAYMRSTASDKADFLPTEKDYESPSDPDGSKGMAAWKKDHEVKGKVWV